MDDNGSKSPKVVAIIEARMGSSRLPGKVLKDINGKPAIGRLITRLKYCQKLDDVVIATTTSPKDDVLADWAKNNEINCFRGSEEDVLQRVVDASAFCDADIIVEVTGDCILTDYTIIDQAIMTFLVNACDVVTNCGAFLSFPMGVYAQVFRAKDLLWISENIKDPAVREHVSLYFYENTDSYSIFNMVAPAEISFPEWRLQLDYLEDYELLTKIYAHLEPIFGEYFTTIDICKLLNDNPKLLDINKHCVEKAPR